MCREVLDEIWARSLRCKGGRGALGHGVAITATPLTEIRVVVKLRFVPVARTPSR